MEAEKKRLQMQTKNQIIEICELNSCNVTPPAHQSKSRLCTQPLCTPMAMDLTSNGDGEDDTILEIIEVYRISSIKTCIGNEEERLMASCTENWLIDWFDACALNACGYSWQKDAAS